MAENDFEKTEQPTPRRREEARSSGNIARSTDLNAAAVLLGAIILLHIFGLEMFTQIKLTMKKMIEDGVGPNALAWGDAAKITGLAGRATLSVVAPFVLGISAIALLANIGQVGFLLSAKPLMPNLNKLSPLGGLKNIFSMRGRIRVLMSVIKLVVVFLVAHSFVSRELPRILLLAELEPLPMFAAACEVIYGLALKLAALLLVLGLLDYAFQRWQHTRDLMMSKQDIKEEMRRMEGDPLIKQRRAKVARQLVLQRIGQAVPNADVVVTNPTHFAVALRYESGKDESPRVIAKGADFLAMRIRQLAIAHGVPMVERKELARALYEGVEVGQQIPPQFYTAVAEILAYVYRLSGRKSA